MTSVFHSNVNNILPWQANYTFPSQATKVNKQTVQIQPKGGQTYNPGQTIRIEFPSDGYMNMLNSVLLFDLTVGSPTLNSYVTTVTLATAQGVQTATLAANPTTTYGTGTIGYSTLRALNNTADSFVGWHLAFEGGPFAEQVGIVKTSNGAGVITSDLLTAFSLPDGVYTIKLWYGTHIQPGGAHQLFKRVRWLYGGMPLEDHPDYPMMTRLLMNAGVADEFKKTSGAILDGTATSFLDEHMVHANLTSFQTLISNRKVIMDQSIQQRTVALNLFSGLSTCKKLIPLKWMAAQLVLELTLATPAEALISMKTSDATFQMTRVNYLAELLEFDSTYDTAFYMSLKDKAGPDGSMTKGGVPLKLDTWHYHSFNLTGKDNVIQVHERARSVKSVWAVIRDQSASLKVDSCRSYFDTAQYYTNTVADPGFVDPITGANNANVSGYPALIFPANAAPVTEYQWRIGGRYYPAQPVNCDKGGAEAYIELLKTIDGLGDYHFCNGMSPRDWTTYNDRAGGSKFIMCAELEHSDVFPDTVSGINSEEMSDLTLILKTANQPTQKRCDVFVYYDSLIVIRDMNVVDLVM